MPSRVVTRLIGALAYLLLSITSLPAQPTDNPLASYGDGGYPVWTDSIAWDNVILMTNHNDGAQNFAAFETARDQLAEQGGGVLYYPAGTWPFSLPDMGYGAGIGPSSRGLMLKNGVVIRGETYTRNTPIIRNPSNFLDVSHNLYPTTIFQFEFQQRGVDPATQTANAAGEVPMDWSFIGMAVPEGEGMTVADVENIGVVNVELNGGTIFWGFHVPRSETLDSGVWFTNQWKNNWPAGAPEEDTWAKRVPDGTHYMDAIHGGSDWHVEVSAGSGRLVYGVRIIDGAPWNDMFFMDHKHPDDTALPADAFHHYRYTGRISAHGSNIFIANNVLDMPTKNFVHDMVQNAGVRTVLFDYANNIGIDINKSNFGGRQNHPSVTDPGGGYYFPNIIVRNNWVFSRGNKGFETSGTWMILENNHNERYYANMGFPYEYITNPQSYPGATSETGISAGGISFEGWRWQTTESVDDYMSRGYDLSGRNIWVTENSVINTGSRGNDGEGILIQRHNNVETYSWAVTYNENGRLSRGHGTVGEPGYIAGYDVHNYGALYMGNRSTGFIGHVSGFHTAHRQGERYLHRANHVIDFSLINNEGTAYHAQAGALAGDQDRSAYNPDSHELFEAVYDLVRYGNVGDTQTRGLMSDEDANRPVAAPTPTAVIVPGEGVMITYVDAADNEVGYRIDRRIDSGSWETIAYRPRQGLLAEFPLDFFGVGDMWLPSTLDPERPGFDEPNYPGYSTDNWSDQPITELNPASWMDYTAPLNAASIDYRVIALSATGANGEATATLGSDVVDPDPEPVYIRIEPQSSGGGTPNAFTMSFVPEEGKSYMMMSVDSLDGSWSEDQSAQFTSNGDGSMSVDVTFEGDRRFYLLGYED